MSTIEFDIAKAGGVVKKAAMWGVGLIALAIVANDSFFTVNAGWNVVYQNTITGGLTVYNSPGVKFRVPFFNQVEEYKQVATIAYRDVKDGSKDTKVTLGSPEIPVRFADTYESDIPGTFRFKLPVKPDQMIALHKDFRSFGNFVTAMLDKTARNVVVETAQQYTGEEFYQGGLSSFKTALQDQLAQGLYVTRRQQVEVEVSSLAKTGLDQADSTAIEKKTELVWKTIPVTGIDGKPLRQENPFQTYGVIITQVTIGSPTPEKLLATLLEDKKKLVAQRIKTVQKLETAQAEAKTAQAEEEIKRTVARQQQLKIKDVAVIKESQAVEVARQLAEKEIVDQEKLRDLALIERDQALKVAEANAAIRKAEYAAAIDQAKAVKEVGFAEAAVTDAKYKALENNKSIYLAEIERDVATVLYENMKDFEVKMPSFVMNGSGSEGGTVMNNMGVLTSLIARDLINKGTAELAGPRAEK